MFEKISGFFKQFTRRRKRQSGETTIMESKEPGVDEFGLDGDFDDMDTFGDTEGSADSGGFIETADMSDTTGFSDFDLEESGGEAGGISDGFETPPRAESEFSEFDVTGADADISTGATDFDARTISDEISGPTEAAFDEGDVGDAFGVGEEAPAYEGAEAEAKAASPIKRVLITVVVLIVAVGVGAAFQIFAWPTVSTMIGMGASGEVPADPETLLGEKTLKNKKLNTELNNFKQVGTPAEAQNVKTQVATLRDSQGSMEEFKAEFTAVKEQEAAYDALLKEISTLEENIRATGAEIENVRVEIDQAKRRVIQLARQTEEEYERFSFELARAELGQRLLIELQIQDIESIKEAIAKLEQRLAELSAATLVSSAVEAEAPTVETSEN
jgi:exoribonuclease R